MLLQENDERDCVMRTNRRGIALIQNSEGCRLRAYLCSAGVPTLGWGSTGPDIRLGMTWTQEQADDRFARDLQRFERGVESLLTFEPTSNEFSALVSFAYNVGVNALAKSTLLRKFNAGDIQGSANEFLRWNRAGGMVLAGLTRRREAERDLFLTPDDNDG